MTRRDPQRIRDGKSADLEPIVPVGGFRAALEENVAAARPPELLELARKALEYQDKENARLAAMSPEERERAIQEWARKLADDVKDAND